MNNIEEFITYLLAAESNGTLMLPKHDPANLHDTQYISYRSVISDDLANNLKTFIESRKFKVVEYINTNPAYVNTPLKWFITPDDDSGFSVPSSGVTSNNNSIITKGLDGLVVVSGSTCGIHMYGGDSSEISSDVNDKKLKYIKELH